MEYPTHPCPQCHKPLAATGVLSAGGVELPTYQCDTCLRTVDLFGEKTEVAYTFCVNAAGDVVDPNANQ